VIVALAVRVPEVAVNVAEVGDPTLAGGVYVVLVPVEAPMLPGPLSAQDTVPLALRSALVKLTGGPPATTVLVDGETDSEGVFPPLLLLLLFGPEPPQPMRRQSSETDVSHRAFGMSDSSLMRFDGTTPLPPSPAQTQTEGATRSNSE